MVSIEEKERYKELLNEQKSLHKNTEKQMKQIIYVSIAIGVIIGSFIAFLAISGDIAGTMDIDKFMLEFYGGLALFLIAFVVHIILHELGHLVFGRLTGYQLVSFRIFSTIFYKNNGKIHKKKFSIRGTAGQCLMLPPKRKEDGSFPFALYNLGGGISNLIFSLPFLIPAILTNHSIARICYIAWVLAGVLLALTNLIPMNPGIQNDGMNLKSMQKDKVIQDAFYLQLVLNAEMSEGKQIGEYPTDTFTLPEGANDTNMLTASIRLYAYYQQLACGNYTMAEELLTKMEANSEKYIPGILNLIEAERLFFQVINKEPIEAIAARYARSRLLLTTAKTNVGIQRIQYVYETLLTEEEKKDIMTLIKKKVPRKWKICDQEKLYQQFQKVAKNFPVSGEAAMYVDIVEDIRKKIVEDSRDNAM